MGIQKTSKTGWLQRKGADRHLLYQWSVQAPDFEVWFMDKVFRKKHGRAPVTLREDFCGTAILSASWVLSRPDRKAVGLDLDTETLDWARANNLPSLVEAGRDNDLELREVDVRTVTTPPVDVVCACNFSYFLIHPQADLVAYFKLIHASLGPEGMFFMDCYGGWDSQRPLTETHMMEGPEGKYEYVWDQAAFNPIDNLTTCHIHFGFAEGKKWKKAFTYHWRLYSPAEICDCLKMAGFAEARVFWDRSPDEDKDDFRPARKAANMPGWLAYIVGEK